MAQSSTTYVASLIERARAAQREIEFVTQSSVDNVCAHVARAGTTEPFARKIAELAVEETGMGRVDSKYAKMMSKVKGAWRDMKGRKTVGVIERDDVKGIVKIAKPVGVIGALIPVTNCEATPFLKALSAIKTRNAIILAPHPKAVMTGKLAADRIRSVLARQGFPEDLVQVLDQVSVEASQELMAQSDLVLATGGPGMVKAAYSSGTPALGVGAGNAVTIVDSTANLDEVADRIMRSKTFDWATSCSTENSCLAQESIYDAFKAALERAGAFIVTKSGKQKMQDALWPDGKQLNRNIVAQPPQKIAKLAGIDLPEGCTFFVVEEDWISPDNPFTGEKLSVVMSLLKYREFDEAVDMVNRITGIAGGGHSCGIHTTDNGKVMKLAEAVRISRVIVNQPQCLANSGAWTNGMPMTLTLGCGTWGGNISSDNITYEKLLNTTWVSWPIPSTQPTDEELFGAEVMAEHWD